MKVRSLLTPSSLLSSETGLQGLVLSTNYTHKTQGSSLDLPSFTLPSSGADLQFATNTTAEKGRVELSSTHHATREIINSSQQVTWNPSDKWIEDCIRFHRQNNRLVRVPYEVKWVKYQLGDCIKQCKSCDTSAEASQYRGSSIAGEYWRVACNKRANDRSRGNNFTFLDDLFKRYEANPDPYKKPWPRPANDELVIHLRIGDVMDDPNFVGEHASVFQMLREGADTRHGKSANYPKGIKSIHEYLSNIRESGLTKIVLRGGSHFPKIYPNSRIFTSCLSKAIERAGYNITNLKVAGEDNPDQDFFYMAHAKYFLPATGGYSRLIANSVERRGGTIVGRRFGTATKQGLQSAPQHR